MTLEVVTRIAPIAEEWERLAEELGAPPWLRPGWFEAWAEAFGPAEWRLQSLRRDGRLVGVVPLLSRRRGLVSAANWHTPEFSLLAQDGLATELARGVIGSGPAYVELDFVNTESTEVVALKAAAVARGYRVLARPRERSPFVDLAEGWESYETKRPRKVVSEIRRRHRRLEELGKVDVQVSDGRSNLADLLAEGFRVESAGWKGERGSAIASQAATRRFYTELAAWAASQGWLRLAFLRLDGRPLAFDFALEDGTVHALLKTGFDPEYARFAPGTLLRREMLRRAFSRGLARYDFLGADDPWKLEWTQTVRERSVVQAFAPSAIGMTMWSAYRHGRPAAKRILGAVRR